MSELLGYTVMVARPRRSDPAATQYDVVGSTWPTPERSLSHLAYCQALAPNGIDPDGNPARYLLVEVRAVSFPDPKAD